MRPPPLRPFGLLSLVALLAAALCASRAATPYTMSGTDLQTLPTSVNGRTYLLYISLPGDYASHPDQRFPVVYFPDAYWDFTLLATASGNLHADNIIPEVILVGIGYAGTNPDVNALRALDLTPGIDPWFDFQGTSSGQADAFIGVLRNQIMPYVEQHYRTDPTYRVLAGNSFGGLFATYVALTQPGLFKACIASSPAVWWRSNFLAQWENDYARTHTSFPIRLFLGYGTYDSGSITQSTLALYQQIQSHHYSDIAIALREVDGERHSSCKPDVYTRGLRFAFAPVSAMGTTALKGTTMKPVLYNVSTRGPVGTGDSVLIGGFVVNGYEPKRVLVRGIGPTLSRYSVPGVLADPYLRVFNANGNIIAENDNWGSTPEISNSFAQAGAYALPSGTQDAALVVTLAPGAYTAIVSGVNATTGIAQVEAYELP